MKKVTQVLAAIVMTLGFNGYELSAQAASQQHSKGLATMKADHILMGVTNFEETVKWYKDILGFEVEVQWKVEGLDNLDLAYLTNGDFRIEIIGNKEGEQNNKQVSDFGEHLSHQGYAHICFQVEDIDLAMKELNDKGIETFVKAATYPLDFYKRRVAFIKDLNGNIIEFGSPIEDTRLTKK